MGADVCSALVPAAPAETEDFGVDVEASEETVRAGQPFNVTCTGPPGPGFQQQWLHPKSQARPLDFFSGKFLGLASQPPRPISYKCLPCFRLTSFPAVTKP